MGSAKASAAHPMPQDRHRTAAGVPGQRLGAGVGDRVVGEHGERREADRATQVGCQDDDRDDEPDGQLGMVRHLEARVHRRQGSRQVAVSSHGERRPRHSEDQREQGSRSAATAAPTRTTDSSPDQPSAATAVASGSSEPATADGPMETSSPVAMAA